MHPVHNCHHIKSCHPPDKQYIKTHNNTEFIIYTCSLFLIFNTKVSRARAALWDGLWIYCILASSLLGIPPVKFAVLPSPALPALPSPPIPATPLPSPPAPALPSPPAPALLSRPLPSHPPPLPSPLLPLPSPPLCQPAAVKLNAHSVCVCVWLASWTK